MLGTSQSDTLLASFLVAAFTHSMYFLAATLPQSLGTFCLLTLWLRPLLRPSQTSGLGQLVKLPISFEKDVPSLFVYIESSIFLLLGLRIVTDDAMFRRLQRTEQFSRTNLKVAC